MIEHSQEWEQFVLSQKFTVFLQSFNYTDFLRNMNEPFWIVGLYDDNKLIGGSLISGVNARRGRHLVLPYGPIVNFSNEKQLQIFFDFVKGLALRNNYSFIRFSPFNEDNKEYRSSLERIGAKKAPIHILAEHTWILHIQKSESELLREMNKNHRNLISRCKKEGVIVTKSASKVSLDALNDMHTIVAKRHKFHRFSKNFIQREFSAFAQKGEALIFEARLPDGRLDSSAIIIFYGNMAAYRHSASLQLDKRLPTSYLIQWEAIQEAKKRGIVWYNFWGIAPQDATPKHPFFGITHFKKGFGGMLMNLIPCHDIPLKWTYYLTKYFEILRSIKRGFK